MGKISILPLIALQDISLVSAGGQALNQGLG